MLPNEVYVIESYGGKWEDTRQSSIEFCLYENEAIARVKELLEEETKLANFFNSTSQDEMDTLRNKELTKLFDKFKISYILKENGDPEFHDVELGEAQESPEYWEEFHRIWTNYPDYYEPTFYRFKKVERSK